MIENEDVFNIAITGEFGTGKSTIIKAYIKNKIEQGEKKTIVKIYRLLSKLNNEKISSYFRKKIKVKNKIKNSYIVLNIGTILNYNYKKKNNVLNAEDIKLVDEIEKSIIRQIMYRSSNERLYNSDIRRLNTHKRRRFLFNICIVYCSIYITNFIFLKQIINFMEKIKIKEKVKLIFSCENINFLLSVIFLLAICIILYNLAKHINIEIKKSSIEYKDYEFKIKDYKNKDLAFSSQLYEIIYFFSENNVKAVFFEDLDRFPKEITIKVIEELKLLNSIINNRAKCPERVVFFYSLKDDVFAINEERVKEFDYIISVVPILTPTNARNQFNILRIENNVQFSENLLNILSKYIFDYRMIIAIINDYKIFREIVVASDKVSNTKEQKNIAEYNDKLMAICAIKNVYIDKYHDILTKEENIITKELKKKHKDSNKTLLGELVRESYITDKYRDYITRLSASEKLDKNEIKFINSLYNKKFCFIRFKNGEFILNIIKNNINEKYAFNTSLIIFSLKIISNQKNNETEICNLCKKYLKEVKKTLFNANRENKTIQENILKVFINLLFVDGHNQYPRYSKIFIDFLSNNKDNYKKAVYLYNQFNRYINNKNSKQIVVYGIYFNILLNKKQFEQVKNIKEFTDNMNKVENSINPKYKNTINKIKEKYKNDIGFYTTNKNQ